MKKAPQKFFLGCWRREGGGEGRKNKCNYKSKAVEVDSRMKSNESDRKN